MNLNLLRSTEKIDLVSHLVNTYNSMLYFHFYPFWKLTKIFVKEFLPAINLTVLNVIKQKKIKKHLPNSGGILKSRLKNLYVLNNKKPSSTPRQSFHVT